MAFWKRFRALFHPGNLNGEIEEELRAHIEMRTADNIGSGMSPDAARRDAMLKFGNSVAMKEKVVGVDAALGLDSFFRDLRYAFRQLRKSPVFALTAILTLALGIGATTAMFAIVDGVLLRPLVFPHASQLYVPAAVATSGDLNEWISYSDIQQWQKATHDSAQIAFSGGHEEIVQSNSGAQLVNNDVVSTNLLQTLGVQPMLGRGSLSQEEHDGQSHVAILSYAIWQQVFAGSPQALGKTLRIGDVLYNVIGVMPPRFAIPFQGKALQVFTPIERSTLLEEYAHTKFMPIIRLKPGTTSAALQARLSAVQAHIAQTAKPGDEVATHVQLTGLRDSMVANVRPALTALEIAVSLIWMIACCNVAGLLLARLASRRVEIAVRGALGAGKWRVVRQFLTESLLLSAAGALTGLGLAAFTLEIFRRMLEKNVPQSQNIHFNSTVLLALLGFTLLTGFLFGSIPAIFAARAPIEETLKSGGPTSSGDRGQARLRNTLLVGEIALSMVLLVAAGLMLRTVYALRHVPLGFRTDHIVLTSFTVPNYDYKGRNLSTALWDPLLGRVRHVPGVQFASLSTVMPIGHSTELNLTLNDQKWANGNVAAVARAASPGLTQVLGIPMHAGRFFTPEDRQNTPNVIVVNRVFVRHYLGDRDAIGKHIRLGPFVENATIIGVMENVRQEDSAKPSQPEIYVPIAQLPPGEPLSLILTGQVMELAVRTRTAPDAMIPELRSVIHRQSPDLVAGDFTTMNQAVEDSIGEQRLAGRVIGIFAGLAMLITVVGLYGLLSYSIAQRTREIGVRIALGADRGRVTRMILRQALILLVAGIAAGLALAFWASRFLASFLYGVSIHDPWTLAAVPIVLALCGILAALIPARRAASIDPMRALRSE